MKKVIEVPRQKIKRHYQTIVLRCYEKRSSCSCGCRLLAVKQLGVVFPCCSVLSTALLRRAAGSLAISETLWSWFVLVSSVRASWFLGACLFRTIRRSLIIQYVTTTIKMKQAALSGSVSMTVQFLRQNWNKPLKKSPARKKNIPNEK